MGEKVRIAAAYLLRVVVRWTPPRSKGMRLTLILERWIKPPVTLLSARQLSGYRVRCDLTDSVQKSMFYRGTWEPSSSAMIAEALRPGDTFIDIGANAGHYCLLAAGRVGATGSVHAVEASTVNAERLIRTVSENGLDDAIHVHQVAVSDVAGELVLRDPIHTASPHGMRYLDPGALPGQGELVRVVTADDLLADVARGDVIKIDIEGADLRALLGMQQMMKRWSPRLIVAEADDAQLGRHGDSSAEMIAFMTAQGYAGTPLIDAKESPTLIFRPMTAAAGAGR